MKVEVKALGSHGQRFAGSLAVDLQTRGCDDEVVLAAPVAYDLWVIRDGDRLHVRGSLSSTAELECHRCLASFTLELERDFEVVYTTLEESESEAEHELDETESAVDYYDGVSLDLHHALAEQVLLALPMKVLCSEECKGLCSSCGIDRNRGTCECSPVVDPHFWSLAALRDRL